MLVPLVLKLRVVTVVAETMEFLEISPQMQYAHRY